MEKDAGNTQQASDTDKSAKPKNHKKYRREKRMFPLKFVSIIIV
jgi:hypothetical protein